MGYESRIHVVERVIDRFADELARFDLCKMGYEEVDGRSFREIFDREIDYTLYYTPTYKENADWGKPQNEDCYGDICGATDFDTVIDWLERSAVVKEYDRAACFLECLKIMRTCYAGREIDIVHFGY